MINCYFANAGKQTALMLKMWYFAKIICITPSCICIYNVLEKISLYFVFQFWLLSNFENGNYYPHCQLTRVTLHDAHIKIIIGSFSLCSHSLDLLTERNCFSATFALMFKMTIVWNSALSVILKWKKKTRILSIWLIQILTSIFKTVVMLICASTVVTVDIFTDICMWALPTETKEISIILFLISEQSFYFFLK